MLHKACLLLLCCCCWLSPLQAELLPALKKKVVFSQFEVLAPLQVQDIAHIYDALPDALAQMLARDYPLLTITSRQGVPRSADEAESRLVRQLAAEVGAQFVVSGRVLSAAQYELPRSWRNPLLQRGRELELEYTVYDGYQGVLLTVFRVRQTAQGEVVIGRDKPVGSEVFFANDYGQAVLQLLKQSSVALADLLLSEPFKARIIRREGNRVYLDAGMASGLRQGDRLVVRSRNLLSPVVDLAGNYLGETEKSVDTLQLAEVQTQFAVAELDQSEPVVKVGDLVVQDGVQYQALLAEREAARLAELARQAAQAAAEAAEREARMQQLIAESEQREAERQARLAAERARAEKIAADKARAAAKAREAAQEAARQARRASYEEILRARERANSKPSYQPEE